MLTNTEIEEIADKCMVMEGETGAMFLEITEFAHAIIAADHSKRPFSLDPIPISDRLPGPDDCDAEGRCWWGLEESDDYEACWTLRKMHGIPFDNTRWLPAHALPLPGEGVE